MEVLYVALACVGAYLLGSVPSAVWIGKAMRGIDVREHGSGNMGATNTFRVLGVKVGIPVLLLDLFKGIAAVKLVLLFNDVIPNTSDYVNLELLFGAMAVLGHIFPIFAGFRGGKGVATLAGIVLAISLFPALLAIGVFVITLLLSRYVSLSSILAGISFPILIIVIFKTSITSLMIFSVIVAVLLLFTHQKNIERLINRQENKANLFKKKKRSNFE